MEREATVYQPSSPSPEQTIRWIRYGVGIGLVGVLFAGIICGPIAIYFGVRARTAAATLDSHWFKIKAALIIGLGVFDILFFLIRLVGTIRLIGTGG
jgi:hypothetical protein